MYMRERLVEKLSKMIRANMIWLKETRDKYGGKYDKENLPSDFFKLEVLSRTESNTEFPLHKPPSGNQLVAVKVFVNKDTNINFVEMCLRKSVKIYAHETERAEYLNQWNFYSEFPLEKSIFTLVSKSFDGAPLNGRDFVLKGSLSEACSIV